MGIYMTSETLVLCITGGLWLFYVFCKSWRNAL